MNKYFNTFMAAMAILASGVLASCGDDDDDNGQSQTQPKIQYAHYLATMPENFFEYGDITLTLIHDGDTTYYKMDESTKVDSIIDDPSVKAVFGLEADDNLPGRKIDLQIEFKVRPVIASLNIELNEAGKQKIANASEGEDVKNFYLTSSLQQHVSEHCYCKCNKNDISLGIFLNELEEFLKTYKANNQDILVRKL